MKMMSCLKVESVPTITIATLVREVPFEVEETSRFVSNPKPEPENEQLSSDHIFKNGNVVPVKIFKKKNLNQLKLPPPQPLPWPPRTFPLILITSLILYK